MHDAPAYVVARPFKTAALGEIQRGDRFDKAAMEITDAAETAMIYTRQILPLTPESYAMTNQWRQPDTIGWGWDMDDLVARGLLTSRQVDRVVAKLTAGEPYLGYVIVPVKQGTFTRFEVRSARGDLMRETRFAKVERAREFIDGLPPAEAAATDGAAEESPDGIHVQPGLVDA